jgi:biopolymer transport protein ExbB/TolQ
METDNISWSSMFVCSASFIEVKQTAMQSNPLHEKEAALDVQVDGIYRALKGRISLDNLIPSCIEVAKEIENLGQLKGKEKLDLLQKVLRQALKESNKSVEEKEQILHVIDTIVPMVVQAAILASKSPVVAHVQEAIVTCCVPKVKKV